MEDVISREESEYQLSDRKERYNNRNDYVPRKLEYTMCEKALHERRDCQIYFSVPLGNLDNVNENELTDISDRISTCKRNRCFRYSNDVAKTADDFNVSAGHR